MMCTCQFFGHSYLFLYTYVVSIGVNALCTCHVFQGGAVRCARERQTKRLITVHFNKSIFNQSLSSLTLSLTLWVSDTHTSRQRLTNRFRPSSPSRAILKYWGGALPHNPFYHSHTRSLSLSHTVCHGHTLSAALTSRDRPGESVQGYLAHKKQPTPLGPP